jgi:PPOX class probable FMN-dependent enzyme
LAKIETVEQLRSTYAQPSDLVRKKALPQLEKHCRKIISLSPMVMVGTSDAHGGQDVTPRGGDPGFVQVLDDRTVAIPDWPGNNRLDTLTNLLERPGIGLLFVVPGLDETLRINGRVEIRDDAPLCQRFATSGKVPKTVLVVHVEEAYLHCAKAFMRSKLWSPETRIARDVLPSIGQMIKDQLSLDGPPPESREQMAERYAKILY